MMSTSSMLLSLGHRTMPPPAHDSMWTRQKGTK